MKSPNPLFSYCQSKAWLHAVLILMLVLLPTAAHRFHRIAWVEPVILTTYVLLAVVLRSRVLAYFLAGLSVSLFLPQLKSTEVDPSLIWGGVFGLVAGFIADAIGNSDEYLSKHPLPPEPENKLTDILMHATKVAKR